MKKFRFDNFAGLRQTIQMAALVAGAAVMLSGCTGGVRRIAYINTTPPGAQCRVNGVYYGTTPVEMPYLWNWYYEIKLDKPGYKPVTDTKYFRPAIYNQIPFDFLTEVMPFRTYETKKLDYPLTK